jgi:hypothetical protein
MEAGKEDLSQRLEDRDSGQASGKEDIKQRLEDSDQAHAWIQAKLQVTF